MKLSLRPAQAEDEDLLFRIYSSTREDEMALVPWTGEQKQAFLRMQFEAQRRSYALQFPDSKHDIILDGAHPAGRLWVDRADQYILVVDIALLPEFRSLGIGSRLLRELMAEAAAGGKPLHVHVENFNRARHLYARLGFSKIDEQGIHWLMEWRPAASATV